MTPFEKAAIRLPYIKEYWMRFNSLPDEIQDHLLNMLSIASGCGIYAISEQVKLKKMKDMSDDEIIKAWDEYSNKNNHRKFWVETPSRRTALH